MGTPHRMENTQVRRQSRVSSVTKTWCSCFCPASEESLAEDGARNNRDAAEHPDLEEEMDENDEFIMHVIAHDMKIMHDKGIFHRDLKASNILIWREDKYSLLVDYECSF